MYQTGPKMLKCYFSIQNTATVLLVKFKFYTVYKMIKKVVYLIKKIYLNEVIKKIVYLILSVL